MSVERMEHVGTIVDGGWVLAADGWRVDEINIDQSVPGVVRFNRLRMSRVEDGRDTPTGEVVA